MRLARALAASGLLVALAAVLAAVGALAGVPRSTPSLPARVPILRQAMSTLVRDGAPGVMAYVQQDGQVLQLAAGVADLATRAPMQVGDRIRIASVTKVFVATVVLQLVGERHLSLDDRVARFLPGLVPGGDRITIRELLDHTSGLYDYLDDPRVLGPSERGLSGPDWSPEQLIRVAASHPPRFVPGAPGSWGYSNTDYVVLGLIVQRVTGRRLGDVLSERLFEPLDLRETTFASNPRIVGPFAHGYARATPSAPLRDTSPSSPSLLWGAGSIVSTTADVARFLQALFTGRLLRPGLLRQMETTVPDGLAPGDGYGLGLERTRTLAPLAGAGRLACGGAWGHNGDIFGYLTEAFSTRDGRRQVVVAVNTDSLSYRAGQALFRVFSTAYCGA